MILLDFFWRMCTGMGRLSGCCCRIPSRELLTCDHAGRLMEDSLLFVSEARLHGGGFQIKILWVNCRDVAGGFPAVCSLSEIE